MALKCCFLHCSRVVPGVVIWGEIKIIYFTLGIPIFADLWFSCVSVVGLVLTGSRDNEHGNKTCLGAVPGGRS